jgi:hypothetical protein
MVVQCISNHILKFIRKVTKLVLKSRKIQRNIPLSALIPRLILLGLCMVPPHAPRPCSAMSPGRQHLPRIRPLSRRRPPLRHRRVARGPRPRPDRLRRLPLRLDRLRHLLPRLDLLRPFPMTPLLHHLHRHRDLALVCNKVFVNLKSTLMVLYDMACFPL